MKKERRPYTLRRRAERQAETRDRIVGAALELHGELGPALTSFAAVAERAAVQRHTVYAHFPDPADLYAACGRLFIGTHPFPDPRRWAGRAAGERRLRDALTEVYAYYAENTEILGKVFRDMDRVPVGGGLRAQIAVARDTLVRGWRVPDEAVALALDFHTWRSLSQLGPAGAARLMARMVARAAPKRLLR